MLTQAELDKLRTQAQEQAQKTLEGYLDRLFKEQLAAVLEKQ